jgi:hypothetical protein
MVYAEFPLLSLHRDIIAKQREQLTAEQLAEAQKRANELFEKYGSGK